MTEQEEQNLLSLRDEYIYQSRKLQELDSELKQMMQRFGLTQLIVGIKLPPPLTSEVKSVI